jgi:sulfur carrier protein
MIVELNGRVAELGDAPSVADAVRAAGANGATRGVAVAVDGQVVRRADWERTKLRERQAVEIVRAVQGG